MSELDPTRKGPVELSEPNRALIDLYLGEGAHNGLAEHATLLETFMNAAREQGPSGVTPPQQPGDVGKLSRHARVDGRNFLPGQLVQQVIGRAHAHYDRWAAAQALSTLSPTEGEGTKLAKAFWGVDLTPITVRSYSMPRLLQGGGNPCPSDDEVTAALAEYQIAAGENAHVTALARAIAVVLQARNRRSHPQGEGNASGEEPCWRVFLASDKDWLADHGRKMGPGVGQQAIERLLVALDHVAAPVSPAMAEASAVPLVEGWRPIESAPRDAYVLLWGILDPHPDQRELYANLDRPQRAGGYWCDIDGAWCVSGSTWVGPWIKPTHWMPLPPPPSGEIG